MTCSIGFNSLGIVTQFMSGDTISKLVCASGRKVSWLISDKCGDWARVLCYSALDNISSSYEEVTRNFCENATPAALDCAARINSNITVLLFATAGAGLVSGVLGHIIGRHPLVVGSPGLSSTIKAVSNIGLAFAVASGAMVFS